MLPKKDGDSGVDDCSGEELTPSSTKSVTSFSHQIAMPLINARRAGSFKHKSNEKIRV